MTDKSKVTDAMFDAACKAWIDYPDQESDARMTAALDAALDVAPHGHVREPLAEGRDHLTISGKFQSDKYPWCQAGFVPIKTNDPMARDLLAQYAMRRLRKDPAFSDDLIEALGLPVLERPE